MKRSTFTAILVAMVVVAIGLIAVFQNVLATEHTTKYQRVKISGVPYLRFDTHYQLGAATDTSIMSFSVDRLTDNPCDTTIAILNVYSARIKAADSVALKMRYQYSSDGVTWSAEAPLGTDSTSWATADVAPTYKLTTVRIGSTYGGGWQPFYRVKFLPLDGNDSARVKVDMR